MSKSERKSSIELLRIISMFMIVAYHWQLHAAKDSIYCSELSANQSFSFGIGSWGALGVDIFFIISSYFLINSNKIKIHKLLNMIFKVSIYGTAIVVLTIAFDIIPLEVVTLIKSMMGVFAYQYWFITVYIIIYILHPAMNLVIKSMSSSYHILLVPSLICAIYLIGYMFGEGQFVGRLACGITIYMFIGVLERFPKVNIFEKYCRIGSICFVFGIVALEILLSYLGNSTNNFFYFKCINKIQATNSILMLIAALFVFYYFKNMKLKSNSVINFLGKYVVGAYMIHGGASFIKDYLWDGLLKAGDYYSKPFVLYASYYVGAVLLILFVGIVIEIVYTKIIENNIEKIYMKLKIPKEIS